MGYKGSVSRAFSRSKKIQEKVEVGLCIKCGNPNNTPFQLCFKCGERRRISRRKPKKK